MLVYTIIATIGVYGIVALMVRIDDVGFRLIKISENNTGFIKTIFYEIGTSLVWVLPKLIQLIAIIGTLAMLLVGGGLFLHNITAVHDLFHAIPTIISELIKFPILTKMAPHATAITILSSIHSIGFLSTFLL